MITNNLKVKTIKSQFCGM